MGAGPGTNPAERLLPWRALATTGVASLLVVVAIGVAADRVPRCGRVSWIDLTVVFWGLCEPDLLGHER